MESYWDLLPKDIKRIIICYAFIKQGKPIWCKNISKVHLEIEKKLFCLHHSLNLNNIKDIFRKNKTWHIRNQETNKCIECWN
jgi:hypothetical protein